MFESSLYKWSMTASFYFFVSLVCWNRTRIVGVGSRDTDHNNNPYLCMLMSSLKNCLAWHLLKLLDDRIATFGCFFERRNLTLRLSM